jgi:hypothetical protein
MQIEWVYEQPPFGDNCVGCNTRIKRKGRWFRARVQQEEKVAMSRLLELW